MTQPDRNPDWGVVVFEYLGHGDLAMWKITYEAPVYGPFEMAVAAAEEVGLNHRPNLFPRPRARRMYRIDEREWVVTFDMDAGSFWFRVKVWQAVAWRPG